jgi:hypothetical protein
MSPGDREGQARRNLQEIGKGGVVAAPAETALHQEKVDSKGKVRHVHSIRRK